MAKVEKKKEKKTISSFSQIIEHLPNIKRIERSFSFTTTVCLDIVYVHFTAHRIFGCIWCTTFFSYSFSITITHRHDFFILFLFNSQFFFSFNSMSCSVHDTWRHFSLLFFFWTVAITEMEMGNSGSWL